jgi:hypothetical protein
MSLRQATHPIRYWDARITRRGIRDNYDPVLDYYLLRSNVDTVRFDTTLTITKCIHQLNNARSQLKDVLKDANINVSFYDVEVAAAWV